jgi:flagellar biosynthesis protein FlhG
MPDQATELRRLARQAHGADSSAGCARPLLVVVAGGKGGVGTTTIAVNLAALLAREGRRAMLADMSPAGSDAAILCRLAGRRTVADVLAGRRGVAEALEAGPGGLQVLAGQWGSSEVWQAAASADDQLIEQFQGLSQVADFVVVDAGNIPTRIAQRLWHASDRVLLVATPELASVMSTYAAVKTLAADNGLIPIHTVVNMAPSAAAADDVHARLALACRRFLGLRVQAAGHVCQASQVEDARRRGQPFVLASPGCPASRQIGQLARLVTHPDSERMRPVVRREEGRGRREE